MPGTHATPGGMCAGARSTLAASCSFLHAAGIPVLCPGQHEMRDLVRCCCARSAALWVCTFSCAGVSLPPLGVLAEVFLAAVFLAVPPDLTAVFLTAALALLDAFLATCSPHCQQPGCTALSDAAQATMACKPCSTADMACQRGLCQQSLKEHA